MSESFFKLSFIFLIQTEQPYSVEYLSNAMLIATGLTELVTSTVHYLSLHSSIRMYIYTDACDDWIHIGVIFKFQLVVKTVGFLEL